METTQGYVVGFLFDNECRSVVLMLKNRPDWQKGRLNGIGGHIERGEMPVEAMEREGIEEIGVKTTWSPYCYLSGDRWFVWFFRALDTDAHGAAKQLTDEEIVRVSMSDLPHSGIVPNLSWLIPMALSAGTEFNGPVDHYRVEECR